MCCNVSGGVKERSESLIIIILDGRAKRSCLLGGRTEVAASPRKRTRRQHYCGSVKTHSAKADSYSKPSNPEFSFRLTPYSAISRVGSVMTIPFSTPMTLRLSITNWMTRRPRALPVPTHHRQRNPRPSTMKCKSNGLHSGLTTMTRLMH